MKIASDNYMIEFIIENSPTIGLLFFVGAFIVIGVYALRPKAKKKFDEYGKIPLKDD